MRFYQAMLALGSGYRVRKASWPEGIHMKMVDDHVMMFGDSEEEIKAAKESAWEKINHQDWETISTK